MQDMLVRLLDLPDLSQEENRLLETRRTRFARPLAPERKTDKVLMAARGMDISQPPVKRSK